jgi:hypothetical protein
MSPCSAAIKGKLLAFLLATIGQDYGSVGASPAPLTQREQANWTPTLVQDP